MGAKWVEAVASGEWLDVGRSWVLLGANERRFPGLEVDSDANADPAAPGVGGSADEETRAAETTAAESTVDETTADGGVTATESQLDLTAPTVVKDEATGDPGDTAASIHPDATIRGHVVVEDGDSVGPGVVIEWPVRIRSGAQLGRTRTSAGRR